jgi:Spy/CpxP family protein refolding chaperone
MLVSVAATSFAPGNEPEFMKLLFLPETVMRHASGIELRNSQKKAITQAITETQAAINDVGWEMQDAAQRLGQLVRQTTIDEEAAMAAATQVMELEVKVKKAHMRLLIQIKNLLDPTQQEKLIQLRSE